MKLPSYFKTVFTLIFFVFSLMAVSYVLPSLLLARGFSSWQTGVIVSAFFIGATLARPLGSFAIERLGIKRTILSSAVVGAVVALAYPLGGMWTLIVSRFIVGMCYGIIYVAATTWEELVVTPEDRGRLFGYFCLASIMPQFIIVPISEFLIDTGLENAFMLLSTAILVLLIFYTLRQPLTTEIVKDEKEMAWGTWGELLRLRETWAILSCTFVLCMTGTACIQYIPNLMRLIGLKGTFYTWSLTAGSVVVRLFFCAMLLTRYDRRTLLCIWSAAEAVPLLYSAYSSTVPAFVISGILFGVSHGINYPALCAIIPDVLPPHLLPKGTALYLLCNDLPPVLMPLLIGVVPASFGLAGLMKVIAVIALLAFPVIYWGLWRHPPLRSKGVSA